jgi:hypothetical protein
VTIPRLTVRIVTKRSAFLWAAGAEILAIAAKGLLGFAVVTLAIGVIYLVSVILHPRMRHGRCNGTGEVRSRLFPWVFHRCPGCAGSGRIIRYGAGLAGRDHARQERAQRRRTVQARRQTRSWR